MTDLSALLLPILLSAVLVFVASSVIHMMTPWHKGDYPKLPREGEVMDALRPFSLPPGDYMTPRAESMAEMKSAEYVAARERGPVMIMTVMPSGQMAMGGQLAQWFLYSALISFFAAYVASRALAPAAPYGDVFRFVGTAAFLGYAGALAQQSIWYRRSWGITLRSMADGLLYALLTGGVFGWLWPR